MARDQYIFEGTHVYNADPKKIFPLLCPVYEADYLVDWEYEMVYSTSGFAELGCVFTTPHQGDSKTIWTVTLYDPKKFIIEFTRFTPNSEVVTISIFLKWLGSTQTEALIRYVHTPLSYEREEYLITGHDEVFKADMAHWEHALNHYLETGKCLT